MFPSRQTADFHSSQNGGDALALAFMAAKQTNMQLWIGTVSDDLWWKFGWGVPQGSFFADWSADNAGLCADLIAEIWERYGTEYGDRIAGWYYDSTCSEPLISTRILRNTSLFAHFSSVSIYSGKYRASTRIWI